MQNTTLGKFLHWFRAVRPVAGAAKLGNVEGGRKAIDAYRANAARAWRWRYSLEDAADALRPRRWEEEAAARQPRFLTDEEEAILRSYKSREALRRSQEEGAGAQQPGTENAMGKRGRIPPDVVSPEAPSQDEITRQIKAQHWAFTIGSIVGMSMGWLGGCLCMLYILMLLGKIKL
jgi:hypothetical protein